MKKYQNEEAVNEYTDLADHYKMDASDCDDDREDREEEEEDEKESQDWGDVDPDGGPAPSAPGSAV